MEEPHKCKYCGVETTQPDEECYAKPKQETLEEFIKEELQDEFFTNISEYKKAERFIQIGAEWQQKRMYSEEDMREAIRTSFLLGVDRDNYSKELEDKLIEQFKKK